jgi:hypothetical protein
MEKQETRYIVLRDGFFSSILADSFTFLCLIFVLGLNHFKLDDSTFGAIMLGLIFFIFVSGKTFKTRIELKGKEAIKNYLKQLNSNQYD